MHGDGGGATDRAVEGMRHNLVEIVQRRPPVSVAALLGQAQLFATIIALRIARSSSG